ncbi:hypothetical protein YPPY53_3624, partial [Yersinia pestis PY-53]
MNHQKDQK